MEVVSDLKERLEENLSSQLVSSKVLLNGFRVIDESSRKTAAYQDPIFAPFYYHLGKHIAPKTVICIGFGLGFFAGCFFKSCKSVDNFLAIEIAAPSENYSGRLGLSNVKDHYRGKIDFYVGSIFDEFLFGKIASNEWDLVLVDSEMMYDTFRSCLDVLWDNMSVNGLLVMDRITKSSVCGDVFFDFCKISNREPLIFATRCGTGIVQK